ncbi:hypothetical protein C1886_04650 [Pseudomonas sp. FW300-N1A1]|uniref:DUF262 domain-containing protein n=1 Tax=Pseudomonas sp. FW300-N1A1 TaxID=2075555 RepID=UPI000CD1670F|nr:DUF262 domain-containing protein [Pseudomonas sp. FW300-N1A1]POA21566.1 hypothetical protein C1886_04650 [Pseudomonas sp. FW300-N1A1]
MSEITIEDGIELPEEERDDYYSDDDLFDISSWGADLSFRELIARYDDDELVKPELQRNYVWDKAEASRFIDSVLLGLPVPSIFLAKTNDEKLLIIDGYQRLMTVRDFVKGIFSKDGSIFKLSRSGKIHERWKGKSFLELPPEDQRKIRNTTIHAIIFMQKHPADGDTSLYQVFERINSSGRSLLPQEIRNCVYQGPMNSLLFELNKLERWRTLWGKPTADSRMRDLEMILRFFALSSRKIQQDVDSPNRISLKQYLNQYMDSVNNINRCDDFRTRFETSIDFIFSHIGPSAFHNISPSDNSRLVPNFSPTIFDSVMTAVDLGIRRGIADKYVAGIEDRRLTLLCSPDYQRLLSHETMRVPNIRSRVYHMYYSLFEGEAK